MPRRLKSVAGVIGGVSSHEHKLYIPFREYLNTTLYQPAANALALGLGDDGQRRQHRNRHRVCSLQVRSGE